MAIPTIIFRPVQLKDKPMILDWFKKAAERIHKMNIDHWQHWKNPPADKVKWMADGIAQGEFFFIDFSTGENLGMIRILGEDLPYWGLQLEKAKYVHSLVIHESHNGKGYGSMVLNAVERLAASDKCKFLRLDADSKNPKLCLYYEKQGFKKVGEKELPISTYNLYERAVRSD